MTEKKPSEMTFKEFIEAGKAAKNPAIDEIEKHVATTLKKEGLTDEQIYEMAAAKWWPLYMDALALFFQSSFSEMHRAFEVNPNLEKNRGVKASLENLRQIAEKLEKERKDE